MTHGGAPVSEHTETAPGSIYGPVEDWATDIDHADPSYNPRAPEIWAELPRSSTAKYRSSSCGLRQNRKSLQTFSKTA